MRRTLPKNEPFLILFLGATLGAALLAMGWYMGRLDAERDPVLHALLNAPEDDEDLTPEQEQRIAAGRAEAARGDVVPWSEVRRSARVSA